MSGYFSEDIAPDDLRKREHVASDLAAKVRELIADTVLTEIDADAAAHVIGHLDAASQVLRSVRLDEDSFGVRFNTDGTKRTWGNAVNGIRNPIAPPVLIQHDGELSWSEIELGAAYEGPAGLVHGGILAAILDQMLGSAAEHSGHPGMTGTLTIRYRRGTPLGKIRAEAGLDRVEGVKSIASGRILTSEGVTVEAEGVFILPRWARGGESTDQRLHKSLGDG